MSDRHDEEERAFAERFRRGYLETPAGRPAERARIVAAVQAARRPRRGWLDSWLAPRTFTVRPVAAVAAALALVALGVVLAQRVTERRLVPQATVAGAPAAAGTQTVRFVFVDPAAASVILVGDFNGWDATATPLAPGAEGGTWSV